MDTAQWTQEINGVVVKSTEDEMDPNSRCSSKGMLESRKVVRAEKEQALNCPRCNSTNTKFCYYNNYSLTQPRYFCKTCRRYWTEGGSLRNVPVGGGSRKISKQQRSSSSSSSTSSSSNKVVVPDLNPAISLSQFNSCQSNSKTTHEGQYLNLGFQAAATQEQEQEQDQQHHAAGVSQFLKLPKIENNNNNNNNTSTNCTWQVSALELLKTGNIGSSSGLNSFVSTLPMQHQLDSNNIHTPLPVLFPFQEFKPNLNFCADHGTSTRFGITLQENGNTTTTTTTTTAAAGRLMFPFGSSLKESPNSTSELVDQNKGPAGNYTGHYYWNGMFGGR